jgi:hypothetical protein
MNVEQVREATEFLADGQLLKRISRHNANEFAEAVAVVVVAACLWIESRDAPEQVREGRCAGCGLPAHRYGTNDPDHDYDPMACVNSLRGLIEDAPRIWVYQTSRLSGTFAACNPEDADGYVVLIPSPGESP